MAVHRFESLAERRCLAHRAEDMTVQIEVWPGQKTLTVPFELKDVKLP